MSVIAVARTPRCKRALIARSIGVCGLFAFAREDERAVDPDDQVRAELRLHVDQLRFTRTFVALCHRRKHLEHRVRVAQARSRAGAGRLVGADRSCTFVSVGE